VSEANFRGSSGGTCVGEEGPGTTAVEGGVAKGAVTTGFGDSGGVESRKAFSKTSGGGRERGEMMMPGARDGSVGRRDQMAQPPNCCFASDDDMLCVFVEGVAGTGGIDT
jgi:hypothetical protein